MNSTSARPHPIPYQGSKRKLANTILSVVSGKHFNRLYEPFAGSAAVTIAAAEYGLAEKYVIGDSLTPLMKLWSMILRAPDEIASQYREIWNGQKSADGGYFNKIRDEFNHTNEPAALLYLLARCVKNSPRFNKNGKFNQSHDKRRLGMRPEKMEREISRVARLLGNKTLVVHGNYEDTLADAGRDDLVYMDPPWEGTTNGKDRRYHEGLHRAKLISLLEKLNDKDVPYILSYDGSCGEKTYGEPLPSSVCPTRLEISAGRSSQATLNGHAKMTIESLYVSSNLGPCKIVEQLSLNHLLETSV